MLYREADSEEGISFQANKKRIYEIQSRFTNHESDDREKIVRNIITDVRIRGNEALKDFSQKFDNYELSSSDLSGKLDFSSIIQSGLVDKPLINALTVAENRIRKYHEEDLKHSAYSQKFWEYEGDLGERLGAKFNSLDSVAAYVPGGNFSLISTVLMTVIPAKVAGVKRVILFTPPPINNAILAAAHIAGVDEIYPIGGAQAIAAAAYGTETISPVSKIIGPGNIYVTLAKKQVFGRVGIDGIFGPSELAIFADYTASPRYVAADFLSQLEHGSGLESALLVSDSLSLIAAVKKEIETQIEGLVAHKTTEQIQIIRNSYAQWSDILYVANLDEAVELINLYAPEHFELIVRDSAIDKFKREVVNAGAMFIGNLSSESLGDYIAGPSHCLPTAGAAKFSSGLSVADFFKKTSIIDFKDVNHYSAEFQDLSNHVIRLAREEGLEAHARSMSFRVKN